MPIKKSGSKQYYGESGVYLKEHAEFLKQADPQKDVVFLIRALGLKKNQQILDIACGQGRHVCALISRGYHVDGLDFSAHLLALAKKMTDKGRKNQPIFYRADVMKLTLDVKYDRAYWFFSDLADIDPPKTLKAISRNLKVGGRLLLDTDNLFRLTTYLQSHPNSGLSFDAQHLMLIDAQQGLAVPYLTAPAWEALARQAGLKVDRLLGDYQFHPYQLKSPRLILILTKTA